MAIVLIIDDDPDVSATLGRFFERGGHQVVRAASGEDGIDALQRVRPDLVLLDVRLPDISGFDVLSRIADTESVVVMITGHADVRLAVDAMRRGAENFLTKPVELDHLAAASARALEKATLRQMTRWLRDRRGGPRISGLLGTSPEMLELAQQVEMLAATDRTTVLLVGEAGTGKGRMAELIHEMSPRAHRAFLEASCVASTADALDAELFGTEGSARRPGVLELADGGTLFLADINEVPIALQPRLLRVLDGGRVRRSGGEIAVDVRLIAATSADLATAVTSGELREDLYYRLSVMPVHLPPLRARAHEDLLGLVARVMAELHTQLPGAPAELGEGALEMLLRYAWPGNLRELRNVLERAMIVGRGQRRIAVEHLPDDVRRATGAGVARHVPRTIEEVERAHIERTLKVHGGNRTRTARELGISRATLINKIKGFALDAERAIPVTRVDAVLPEAGPLPAGGST